MRRLIYMAHPVAPTEMITTAGNIRNALVWLSWLRRSFPETTFIAPWISVIQSLGNSDLPADREAGLVDDCTVVERCDGIVLVGERVSSGMARERDHGSMRHKVWVDPADHLPSFEVYDMTDLGSGPEDISAPNLAMLPGRPSFHDWYACAITPTVWIR